MTLYSIALFVHVVGALLLFVTLTVEGVALRLLYLAATPEAAGSAAAMLRVNRMVGPLSALGVLIPGLYMTATTWGGVAWIVVALVSWLMIAVLGAVNGVRIVALVRSQAPAGVYHATSSGEATWFEEAREIFRLLGADPARVRAIASSAYPSPAPRPGYSVLGHDAWAATGVEPIGDWRSGLAKAFPALVATMTG